MFRCRESEECQSWHSDKTLVTVEKSVIKQIKIINRIIYNKTLSCNNLRNSIEKLSFRQRVKYLSQLLET